MRSCQSFAPHTWQLCIQDPLCRKLVPCHSTTSDPHHLSTCSHVDSALASAATPGRREFHQEQATRATATQARSGFALRPFVIAQIGACRILHWSGSVDRESRGRHNLIAGGLIRPRYCRQADPPRSSTAGGSTRLPCCMREDPTSTNRRGLPPLPAALRTEAMFPVSRPQSTRRRFSSRFSRLL